jgi:hypothetical protein
MTARVALLLTVLTASSGFAQVQPASRVHGVSVGAGAALFAPLGRELRDTYTVGFGAGAEIGVAIDSWLRLVAAATPSYSFGDPDTGPLVAEESARLWSVPLSLSVHLVPRARGGYRPYAGIGTTLHYVRERLKFTSGLGERGDSRSITALGAHGLLGVEQNRDRGLFGEIWVLWARGGGVDDGTLSRALGGLELRLGFRGRI